ncbi:MAG: hypothetical protein C4582_09650 [Desulfobacteraceae bacterium]|jgi:methylmalonyl-CoA mutase cobalamin-binding domain/chain|nr:MAG: hypothetical protein C4582_09650 [Desulfobacteraceae bacterium]
MVSHRARILLGVLGEGSKETVLKLAKGLSEAGFEVVYTELKEPAAIMNSAIQESADHIGIAMLHGASAGQIADILRLLEKENAGSVTVTVGGYLEENEARKIKSMGIKEVFPAGTKVESLIEWSKKNIVPLDPDREF